MFWQSTTTWYCFAFDRLLVNLATSVVSLTATIQYHPGMETRKRYAACKKKNSQKSLLQAKGNSPTALELSSPHSQSRWAWAWRQRLAPCVRGEAASPQQGSGLAQTPAETSAAGVTAGMYDRGGKVGASRATGMRKLAVLWLNKIWHRYFGHCLLIGLETERSSIKLLNKKSHNEINTAIERNAGFCKDPGFLSNKMQKKAGKANTYRVVDAFWSGRLNCLVCVTQLPLTQNSPRGEWTTPAPSSHFESKIGTSSNPHREFSLLSPPK